MNNNKKIFSVSEITTRIKNLLEDDMINVFIEGEVSNLSTPVSGHQYFILKDEKSQIRGCWFKFQRQYSKFKLKNGLKILVSGRISVYEPRGEYQIIVTTAEPKGYGSLQLAFEQLKERLLKEGLFDKQHKKPIPSFPKKVAIVTSKTGAAVHDILNILNRRFSNLNILIYPVLVQGVRAKDEISSALYDINTMSDIDVIILGRGGGSIEDLWAFNEEVVGRAIFASKIPIISAVGHETDYTISDFVSDLRAETPSSAAQLVIKNKADIKNALSILEKRLKDAIKLKIREQKHLLKYLLEKQTSFNPIKKINRYQQYIDDLSESFTKNLKLRVNHKLNNLETLNLRLSFMSPSKRCKNLKEKVLTLENRVKKAVQYQLDFLTNALFSLTKRLNSVSPLSVLDRGYSICTEAASKRVIKDSKGINIGSNIDVKLSKGELVCKVIEKYE